MQLTKATYWYLVARAEEIQNKEGFVNGYAACLAACVGLPEGILENLTLKVEEAQLDQDRAAYALAEEILREVESRRIKLKKS